MSNQSARDVGLPSWVGDCWNALQSVMPELEKKADELSEVGGEIAGSFVGHVQMLKECVNHYDIEHGWKKSYPEAGPYFYEGFGSD